MENKILTLEELRALARRADRHEDLTPEEEIHLGSAYMRGDLDEELFAKSSSSETMSEIPDKETLEMRISEAKEHGILKGMD